MICYPQLILINVNSNISIGTVCVCKHFEDLSDCDVLWWSENICINVYGQGLRFSCVRAHVTSNSTRNFLLRKLINVSKTSDLSKLRQVYCKDKAFSEGVVQKV